SWGSPCCYCAAVLGYLTTATSVSRTGRSSFVTFLFWTMAAHSATVASTNAGRLRISEFGHGGQHVARVDAGTRRRSPRSPRGPKQSVGSPEEAPATRCRALRRPGRHAPGPDAYRPRRRAAARFPSQQSLLPATRA